MASKFIIPEGTRDLILEDCAIKKKLQRDIEGILDKWGYEEIVTPTIEFYQTFNTGFENLEEEDVYKFIDSNGKILVLRPDMTVPIARVIATKFKNIDESILSRGLLRLINTDSVRLLKFWINTLENFKNNQKIKIKQAELKKYK